MAKTDYEFMHPKAGKGKVQGTAAADAKHALRSKRGNPAMMRKKLIEKIKQSKEA